MNYFPYFLALLHRICSERSFPLSQLLEHIRKVRENHCGVYIFVIRCARKTAPILFPKKKERSQTEYPIFPLAVLMKRNTRNVRTYGLSFHEENTSANGGRGAVQKPLAPDYDASQICIKKEVPSILLFPKCPLQLFLLRLNGNCRDFRHADMTNKKDLISRYLLCMKKLQFF